jgi:dihydroxyacid dehydratase/phosphogluconate dehydratase
MTCSVSCGDQVSSPRLRSSQWFARDDEVALLHRSALRLAQPGWRRGQPIVGIADSSSDLNPCNLPVRSLIPVIKSGVRQAGGFPLAFPVMSLGEDLMKPTAMLYRNLVAIELEESVRAYPLDALIITAGCDKTTAAALIAAATVPIPALVVLAGSRAPGTFRGKPFATGTDLWRALDERRSGRMSDADWHGLEDCLACTRGTCNSMGTSTTLALVAECLAMLLPGTAGAGAGEPESVAAAYATGQRIVGLVRDNQGLALRPAQASLDNALRVTAAVGGSTNAVIHLAAVAGRLGLEFDLTGSVDRILRSVPLTVNAEPAGPALAQDVARDGGLPSIVAGLGGAFDRRTVAADGRTWHVIAQHARPPSNSIRPASDPLKPAPALAVVRGSLAPDGAVVKVSAATRELLVHCGPAFVIEDYDTLRALTDDPELDLPEDVVLVIRGCGPVAAGMPEWGMAPVPVCLARKGVRDVVRVTDGRMSGTSFGTVVLHVAPEAAIGGPIGLVRNGDKISLDVPHGVLNLSVSDTELRIRRAAWTQPPARDLRGWPVLHRQHVMQAPRGCDLDFLAAPTSQHRAFVEPIVGRS